MTQLAELELEFMTQLAKLEHELWNTIIHNGQKRHEHIEYGETHQICNNSFNLGMDHLQVFGGTLQGDLIFSLSELNVHLNTRGV